MEDLLELVTSSHIYQPSPPGCPTIKQLLGALLNVTKDKEQVDELDTFDMVSLLLPLFRQSSLYINSKLAGEGMTVSKATAMEVGTSVFRCKRMNGTWCFECVV